MKKNCECAACRAGVAFDPASMRAFLSSRGMTMKNPRHLREIVRHVEKHIGPYDSAQIAGGELPLHILIMPPSAERPSQLLITAGMSHLPMRPPPEEEVGDLSWAELVISLPSDWPLTRRALRHTRHAWPLQLLLDIARTAHVEDEWFAARHTIQYNEPLSPGGACFSVLLDRPTELPREFGQLRIGMKEIAFLNVIPILPDEQDYAFAHGPHALADRLAEAGVTGLMAKRRKSAV